MAAASGFSPGSTKPLGRANTARLRLRGVFTDLEAPFELSFSVSLSWGSLFCGSFFCGSIRATCQTPETWRTTTPPAEISRGIRLTRLRRAAGRNAVPTRLSGHDIRNSQASQSLAGFAARRVPHGAPECWSDQRRTEG